MTASLSLGIDGAPANVWRLVLWVAMVFLTERFMADAWRHRKRVGSWRVPPADAAIVWGRMALIVFVGRSAIVQAEAWSAPVTLEGLPFTTLAVALCWVSALMYRRQLP
jgi:hypothetical protein